MSAHIAVLITTGSAEEGRAIAKALVEDRLAACVSILSPMQSVYRWQGKVRCDEEVLLVVKTTSHHLERLSLRVQEMHSYELPEIIALPLVAGSREYLDWIDAQTDSGTASRGSTLVQTD